MKKSLFIAIILTLLTASTALAVDLRLPNGKVVYNLPDKAGNAADHSHKIRIYQPPTTPPPRR